VNFHGETRSNQTHESTTVPESRLARKGAGKEAKLSITPHIAQNTSRKSAIDSRTTRHAGYAISRRIRKRVKEIFGWAKTVGGFRRTRFKGIRRSQFAAYFVGAAYNLVRMSRLLGATG
jgi:hypothetical protein